MTMPAEIAQPHTSATQHPMSARSTIGPALRMLLVLTVLTGLLYPALVTLGATVFFPDQATGSLVRVDGKVAGSALIGQANDAPHYFWPRPSAVNYMAGSAPGALGVSGASNLGPTSATLAQQVKERTAAWRAANPASATGDAGRQPPADLLYASASGLDPHISPQAARAQVARVAAARGLEPSQVSALVEQSIEPPQFGLLGEPRVNVLLLNLALDRLQ